MNRINHTQRDSSYSSRSSNTRSRNIGGSGVAATLSAGVGARATENQRVSCFFRPSPRMSSDSNSSAALDLDSFHCAYEFEKLPAIKAWLKSSPRSERRYRDAAIYMIMLNKPTLELAKLKLTSLPENIGQLQHVTKLELYSNSLERLPESIGNLHNLRELDLSFNALRTLPESIGKLHNLRELDLSWNPLESLPESIGELQNQGTVIFNHQLPGHGSISYKRDPSACSAPSDVFFSANNDVAKMRATIGEKNSNCLGLTGKSRPLLKSSLLSAHLSKQPVVRNDYLSKGKRAEKEQERKNYGSLKRIDSSRFVAAHNGAKDI